ncbi:MAG: flagellar hook capping protein [Deltaproteobacteria bacterium]|nr:flagellar hook capping protein [Deltaproteobacteria bacterium]
MSTTITNGLENIVNTSSTSSASSTKAIGKDEFMKLLLAQLKNQNPLNPMDGTDFAAQLAQFSSLEQLSNLNAELKTQGLNQMTLGYAQSANMIGKVIEAKNGNTVTADGSTVDINYRLAKDAQKVTIYIYDQEERLVQTLEDTAKKEGMNKTTWNCSAIAKGNYSFQVAASDSNGGSVAAETILSGVVTAVHFKNNNISLTVNGLELALSDVVSVIQP